MTARLRIVAPAAALLCCAGTALAQAPALATPAAAPTDGAGAARPGTNLLLNPGAEVGDYSAGGWDAVTIPGWQIVSGLPTVVRYGTGHLPRVTGREPAVRGGQLFVGGAGGTARLRQLISLRSPGGTPVPAGTTFRLSAWLGATRRNDAEVVATFLSAAGKVTGHAQAGPVGGTGSTATLALHAVAGSLPAGTASARITLVLATTLRDVDGPDAPIVGYNRAAADDVAFTVSAPVVRPVLTRPAVHVPRYQHVFLFYFENEDFGTMVGNTTQAPFFNSLLPHASLLASFFAEEHPSDANYLAVAGGSTFGIPLDDPLEENPQYTIRARNISDLVGAAHETWKAYLQSADGPCDDTVHGYYWDDDMPMTYFADVRDRPAFCAAHLVPLQALQTDLASAATTPNFAWVSPDDCYDMEACGIRAGDEFLATELGEIMRSPAWTTQRSLAIITFDEDGTDFQHPAQRIATVIVGSAGVRQGYVSHVRYTHYSLLRTIEAALGLGTLTQNDRYAQAVNDVFAPGAPGATASEVGTDQAVAHTSQVSAPASASGTATATAPAQRTAFVVNSASNTVSPVNLVTRKVSKPIRVGSDPQAIAITPDGATAYVVNSGSGTVTPISTATRRAGVPIPVGSDPRAIAIAPDGQTAYVVNSGSGTVTPIDLATGLAGPPIGAGSDPQAIAITPDGRTALVLDWGGAAVTPIELAPRAGGFPHARRAIPVGSYPFAISIAADGSVAYVANYGSDTVTPIDLGTLTAGKPVPVGQAPNALAVTPDGRQVYVVNGDSDTLSAVGTRTGTDRAIEVGYSPTAVAISPSGQTAFVVNAISGTVTPIDIPSGRAGRPIDVGLYNYPTAIAISGTTGVVVSPYAGQVTLVDTSTRRPIVTLNVGQYPSAVAIAP